MTKTSPQNPYQLETERERNRLLNRRQLGTAGIAVGLALSPVGWAFAQEDPSATPIAEGSAVPPEFVTSPSNWPSFQGGLSADRNAIDSTITSSNVSKLERVWTFSTKNAGGYGAFTATPLVVDDTVYLQDLSGSVFAFKRETGEIIWQRDYEAPSVAGPNGIVTAYGMIFGTFGSLAPNTGVVALDAATGDEIWRVVLSGLETEFSFAGPSVYDNTVFVGTGGMYRGRGNSGLYAFDAATGALKWFFDTVADNAWGNPALNSGAGVWYPPSFDGAGRVFIGTGNPGPFPGTAEYPNGSSRPGPNLYSSSMLALDTATGSLEWYYQAKEHDIFDLDYQNTPVVGTVELDGVDTVVVFGSGKVGSVAMANAETGELYWETKVGTHQNDDLQEVPEGETVEVFPGTYGGVETPVAFANGTVYVPVVNKSTSFTSTEKASTDDFEKGTGEFYALDAVDGSVKWQIELPVMVIAGATVANDVVFTGGLDGVFRALNTETGEEVWSDQLSAGLNAPPAVSGDMVFVPAGTFMIRTADQEGTPVPEVKNEFVAYRIS